MIEPVIVCVAPIERRAPQRPPLPFDPVEVAEDVYSCMLAGASMVHLHVCNREGWQVGETDVYSEALDEILARGDVIIHASTGDRSFQVPREERCPALNEPRTEVAVLNMGTFNVMDSKFICSLSDIRYFAQCIQQAGVYPELRCSDIGMMCTADLIAAEGLLPEKRFYSLSVGMPGSMPASPDGLWSLMRYVPKGHLWGLAQQHVLDLNLATFAVSIGATCIRVGMETCYGMLEQSPWLNNVDVVDAVVRMIHGMGREVATPEQARNILGIG